MKFPWSVDTEILCNHTQASLKEVKSRKPQEEEKIQIKQRWNVGEKEVRIGKNNWEISLDVRWFSYQMIH